MQKTVFASKQRKAVGSEATKIKRALLPGQQQEGKVTSMDRVKQRA
jgi:hypothetical protein